MAILYLDAWTSVVVFTTAVAAATTSWTTIRKRDASLPELGPMGAPRSCRWAVVAAREWAPLTCVCVASERGRAAQHRWHSGSLRRRGQTRRRDKP
ncbi:hypothetical protein M427DRAFT_458721 [Gonapodya prolifera JEL478]|uniref:Uncharacterized protein n=1 Tax=Gonapodya prolifera (strain JEL478) TaxID=1344416 RepID=A0A139A271_GONPJ|nr:hypothetical protein M427DRAFT_458721 [Gonapodya prolifera JEL478]|eukprot:KXS10862.1 hypothetical protein M427DRAFT_458721 [Gonapodya prolifera JEL478]